MSGDEMASLVRKLARLVEIHERERQEAGPAPKSLMDSFREAIPGIVVTVALSSGAVWAGIEVHRSTAEIRISRIERGLDKHVSEPGHPILAAKIATLETRMSQLGERVQRAETFYQSRLEQVRAELLEAIRGLRVEVKELARELRDRGK